MVRFDCRTRALEADAFDDIRVKRPLQQPFDLSLRRRPRALDLLLGGGLNLGCLLLKNVDECVTNDLPLLLGVFDTREELEEAVGGVDNREIHTEVAVEALVDGGGLIHPENTVVHHDSVESDSI